MNKRCLAAVAACLGAIAFDHGATHAQTTLTHRIDTVSAWGGAVNAFQRVGNIGYCGSGQRLVVVDMSNEADIYEIALLNVQEAGADRQALPRVARRFRKWLDSPRWRR